MDNRLPTIDIIKSAFSVSFANRFALVKALLISGILLSAIDLFSTYKINYTDADGDSTPLLVAVYLLWSVVFAIFAINCHRIFLIGLSSIPEYGIVTWGRRELFFLLWGIALTGIMVVPNFILMKIFMSKPLILMGKGSASLTVLFPVLQLSSFYVLSRLSINLPAIAIDKKRTLKQAWHLSKNNGWRLLIIVGILPLAFNLWIGFSTGNSFLLDAFLILVGLILFAIEIAALSLAYRYLANLQQTRV